jgi:hypothetical protein
MMKNFSFDNSVIQETTIIIIDIEDLLIDRILYIALGLLVIFFIFNIIKYSPNKRLLQDIFIGNLICLNMLHIIFLLLRRLERESGSMILTIIYLFMIVPTMFVYLFTVIPKILEFLKNNWKKIFNRYEKFTDKIEI